MDLDSQELCMIDSGIKSMRDVTLNPRLTVLNLHSNQIRRIENLLHVSKLVHLDLSSNRIQKIEGLESLTNLRTLNLACNFIQTVQGLENLRCVSFYCLWVVSLFTNYNLNVL